VSEQNGVHQGLSVLDIATRGTLFIDITNSALLCCPQPNSGLCFSFVYSFLILIVTQTSCMFAGRGVTFQLMYMTCNHRGYWHICHLGSLKTFKSLPASYFEISTELCIQWPRHCVFLFPSTALGSACP
jgi:hypothetical protein